MTSEYLPRDSDALGDNLAHLRTDLIFPETPDIVSALNLQDATRPSRDSGTTPRRMHRPRWRAVAVAAVLLGFIVFALPGTRSTMASWFDFGGIRIEVGSKDEKPWTPPTSIGGTLLLGEQISIEDAAIAAPFEIVAPSDQQVTGAPETYLLERDGAVIVSLLYPTSPMLPEIGTTGVGLLLMQIDSPERAAMLVKRSMNEQSPVPVTVNGQTGTWIAGGTLTVEPVYESGTFERSSGNVLIWDQDGVTYRMESSLSLNDALAVAESLRPQWPAELTS